jgi:hypothetical protein
LFGDFVVEFCAGRLAVVVAVLEENCSHFPESQDQRQVHAHLLRSFCDHEFSMPHDLLFREDELNAVVALVCEVTIWRLFELVDLSVVREIVSIEEVHLSVIFHLDDLQTIDKKRPLVLLFLLQDHGISVHSVRIPLNSVCVIRGPRWVISVKIHQLWNSVAIPDHESLLVVRLEHDVQLNKEWHPFYFIQFRIHRTCCFLKVDITILVHRKLGKKLVLAVVCFLENAKDDWRAVDFSSSLAL